MYWSSGCLRIGAWKSPAVDDAVLSLDEATKAEPSGNASNHRTATAEHREWCRPVSRIRYNRNITKLGSEEYRNYIVFEDRSAVDDAGGEGAVRPLSLRNVYAQFAQTGASIESLMPNYLALMPLISRPANVLARSIDTRYYFRLRLGDIVLLEDEFARDPATGTRGITARPAIVTRLNYSPGGLLPGSKDPAGIVGEVDLFFMDVDSDKAGARYVPSADVDDTYSSGGYSAGYNSTTNSLRCLAHRYTYSSDPVDASHFESAHKVLIIERDPVNPASPVYWEREATTAADGNDITLTTALSSPAWDATKKYRVLFQEWDTAATAQKTKTYQADDADGQIVDDGHPFLYAGTGAHFPYTANDESIGIEIVPPVAYAEGFARDAGYDFSLAMLANNLIDRKCTSISPMLYSAEVSNTDVTGTDYKLIECRPVYLSTEILSPAIYREISTSVMARSTDGTSTKIRVSIVRFRPASTSVTNVDRGTIYSSAEWTGVTSTTAAVMTATNIQANVKHTTLGRAYLLVEVGYKCATWGVVRFNEGPRVLG
jgi:hypothetical protein